MLAPSWINGEWKGARGVEPRAREDSGCAPFCSDAIFLLMQRLYSCREVLLLPICLICAKGVMSWRNIYPIEDEFWQNGEKNKGSSNVHVNQQLLLWNSSWNCSCLMGSSVHQLPYYRPIISSHIHHERIDRTENARNWIKPIKSWVSTDMAFKIYSSFCLRNQIRHRWDRKDNQLK